MLLDDIADYLSSGGLGTVGGTTGTIFKGLMPDNPDTAIAIFETGGFMAAHTMNPLPGQAVCENPSIQIMCRGGQYDYATTRLTAHSIFKLVDGLPNRLINGVEYKWGTARHSPRLMGRDPQGRVMIVCNYDIYKAMTP